MRFRLTKGTHYEYGKLYQAGENDVIETDRQLDKIFVNKFEQLPEINSAAPKTEGAQDGKQGDEGEEDETVEPSSPAGYGEDVTDDFISQPEDSYIFVFRKGNTYTVVDGESNAVLNDEKLTSKKKTENFLIENVEDEDINIKKQ